MTTEDIRRIAVIGAGNMGHAIATCFLLGGYTVILQDIDPEYVQRGAEGIINSLERFQAVRRITPETAAGAVARLKTCTELRQAVSDADFIIEAVPEELNLKRQIFTDLDRYAPAHAILASNTSNISITQIARVTQRPDKVIGCHFFNPAVIMKLVEVIKGTESSFESLQTAYDMALQIGKAPVMVGKDSPGFIYNRIHEPLLVLLSKILEVGHPSPEEFDAAFKATLPMTPFELMDCVGIDVMVCGLEYFSSALSTDYKPSAALSAYLSAGTLGRKTGRGFFDWSAGRPVIDAAKATREYDIHHIRALQINEATKLLEEGVAENPDLIDHALAHGGVPVGPFAMARQTGYGILLNRLEDLHNKFGLDLFRPTTMLLNARASA